MTQYLLPIIIIFLGAGGTWLGFKLKNAGREEQRLKDEVAARDKEREQRQMAREALSAAKDEVAAIDEAVKKAETTDLDKRGTRWTK